MMDQLIKQATALLQGKIRRTPIEYSAPLSKLLGRPIYLKLELLQLTGSFKIRGAYFFLSTLDDAEKKRGVAACSAGNHGLGIAYAAKELRIPCTIYVPQSVDQAKYGKLLDLGAEVVKSQFIGYDDTLAWATTEAAKRQQPLVSAFDDEKIMAANGGTLAVEVLEDLPEVSHCILPMGGGGMAAGFGKYLKSKKPSAILTVCQLEESPAYKLSLEKGIPVTYMPPIETLAGGLEGGLGEKCFAILRSHVDSIAHIKEQELRSAICWFLQQHQYLVEPSAAVTLASCLFGHVVPEGPTVIVLSGRNVSYATVKNLVGEWP